MAGKRTTPELTIPAAIPTVLRGSPIASHIVLGCSLGCLGVKAIEAGRRRELFRDGQKDPGLVDGKFYPVNRQDYVVLVNALAERHRATGW